MRDLMINFVEQNLVENSAHFDAILCEMRARNAAASKELPLEVTVLLPLELLGHNQRLSA